MEPKANSTEEAEAATETLLKESTPVEDKGPSVPGGTLNTGEGAAAAPEGSTTLPPGPSSRGLKNPNRTSRQETWRAQETIVYSKEPGQVSRCNVIKVRGREEGRAIPTGESQSREDAICL